MDDVDDEVARLATLLEETRLRVLELEISNADLLMKNSELRLRIWKATEALEVWAR